MHSNASQESGNRLFIMIVMATDLRCLSAMNLLFKYADDTKLLVPENTNVQLYKTDLSIYNICKC